MAEREEDDRENHAWRNKESENPYVAPITDPSDLSGKPRPPAGSGVDPALRVLGMVVAWILLLAVIGFGLFIGCCGL